MQNVLLVVHLLVALALIGVILLQKSSQDGSQIAGGGTMGGLFTAKGSANLLTRTTSLLATIFICTSLALAVLAGHSGSDRKAIDLLANPAAAPTETQPAAPATPPAPATPEVPIAR